MSMTANGVPRVYNPSGPSIALNYQNEVDYCNVCPNCGNPYSKIDSAHICPARPEIQKLMAEFAQPNLSPIGIPLTPTKERVTIALWDPKSGLFSRGGTDGRMAKKPKVWAGWGPFKNHLTMFMHDRSYKDNEFMIKHPYSASTLIVNAQTWDKFVPDVTFESIYTELAQNRMKEKYWNSPNYRLSRNTKFWICGPQYENGKKLLDIGSYPIPAYNAP